MPDSPAARFVATHFPLMAKLVYRRVHDRQERDDVLGDLALAVLKYHHNYDAAKGRPGTWVGIVLRSVLNKRKARRLALCRKATTVSLAGDLIADRGQGEPWEELAARESVQAKLASAGPSDFAA